MKKHLGKILIMASILALIDQLSKYLIVKYLNGPVSIFGNFFKLEYAENTGIAFGLQIPYIAIITLSIILLALVIRISLKELNLKSKIAQLALVLLIGGALGNIIDRFARAYVVDFISIGSWPHFNLADSFITVAVLLIIAFYGKIKKVNT